MTSPNQLIHETSPYLLQHAYNPVNWYPWNEEALKKARDENKPILVSIGYSACHWCHVMERESFEDDATAQIMNERFVNIKIDREERPDLDHIYMDAVQAMTGSGGWPLNVFLTPDGKPFYGGTYFPPTAAFNRPSWPEVLLAVSKAFQEKRHEIDAQAENLTAHLEKASSFGFAKTNAPANTKERLQQATEAILKTADREWGGFGKAPKFPQTFTLQFLLRYHYATKHEEALAQALLSLDKMIEGGIYDQLGGGFARYSTDKEWLAPHFEKMLYDNALLIAVLSEAFQLTRKERYREVIEETMEFVQRELLHAGGGFYAALDADSEGVEGKYYVWDLKEVMEILGDEGDLFAEFYDITGKGNWEKTNILRVKESLEQFSEKKGIAAGELKARFNQARLALMNERAKRVRPGLDDKIILGWNALMNSACSKAFAATGDERYRKLAVDNMRFVFDRMLGQEPGKFFHTWKDNQAKFPGFLDDYAYLVDALIHLQEITADATWLDRAVQVTEQVIANFSEDETGFFFYTGKEQEDVIVRKKELYDGAVPSGNALMAVNLHRLSILLDRPAWRERSDAMCAAVENAVISYPGSFGVWAGLLLEKFVGTNEVAIVGKDYPEILRETLSRYLPFRVLMAAGNEAERYPLLQGKQAGDGTHIFLCKDYVCQAPVNNVEALISLIHRGAGA